MATDFPDDQVEDGNKIIRPGGRAVAGAVADILRNAGMSTSVPELDYEHGWEFVATKDGRKYWVLVTDLADTKLIQTKDVSPLAMRLFGGKAPYQNFLEALHRILSKDSRFTAVNWFSSRSGSE